jgi:hypothetical protein
MGDHIPDAEKMVELSRSLTRAGVDSPVFRAIDGYWYDDDDGRSEVTPERAERELCYAAILWLMGRGWGLSEDDEGSSILFNPSVAEIGRDTLIDAILAAAEREGEGEE